jgi:hypothetical protein
MSMAEVHALLSAFPEQERIALAAWLLESVAPEPDEHVLDESLKLAHDRQAKLDSGEARSLTEREFWAKVRGFFFE